MHLCMKERRVIYDKLVWQFISVERGKRRFVDSLCTYFLKVTLEFLLNCELQADGP